MHRHLSHSQDDERPCKEGQAQGGGDPQDESDPTMGKDGCEHQDTGERGQNEFGSETLAKFEGWSWGPTPGGVQPSTPSLVPRRVSPWTDRMEVRPRHGTRENGWEIRVLCHTRRIDSDVCSMPGARVRSMNSCH
jgi:hypothetical protein